MICACKVDVGSMMKELMLELDFVNLKKYDGINQCNLVQKKGRRDFGLVWEIKSQFDAVKKLVNYYCNLD